MVCCGLSESLACGITRRTACRSNHLRPTEFQQQIHLPLMTSFVMQSVNHTAREIPTRRWIRSDSGEPIRLGTEQLEHPSKLRFEQVMDFGPAGPLRRGSH